MKIKESTEKRKPEQKKQKPAEGKKKRNKGKTAANKASKKKAQNSKKNASEKVVAKQAKKKPKKKASQPKTEGKKKEGGAKNSKTKQNKGGKSQKAQKSQKKSQKPQKKNKSKQKQKQSKKGKKKMNIRSRLLGLCRKTKSETQLISIFSETLVNDIRFKGKYSNRVEISLDLHGQRMYTTKKAASKPAQKPKKAESEKPVKKKKVNVRQEVLVLCRKTRSEDELIEKFGEKIVNEMRFKGKFSSRIELTMDQFGKRQYTTKKIRKSSTQHSKKIKYELRYEV